MNHAHSRIRSRWRQLTGWTAAYALVLQLIVSAVGGSQLTAHAADQNWSFFEICFGQSVPDGEAPSGTPAKHSSKSDCCAVCANASAMLPETQHAAPVEFSIRRIEWIARESGLTRRAGTFSQRQRAPPVAA